ncbi:MAG: hypothetical protein CME68_02630 [Halobacteriovoraceae bacterium]|nr:hypothetical protein [Halobacteriovoraceae bacterium]
MNDNKHDKNNKELEPVIEAFESKKSVSSFKNLLNRKPADGRESNIFRSKKFTDFECEGIHLEVNLEFEDCDFNDFLFENVKSSNDRETKSITFKECNFYGFTIIENISFLNKIVFDRCIFLGTFEIVNIRETKDIIFRDCTFRNNFEFFSKYDNDQLIDNFSLGKPKGIKGKKIAGKSKEPSNEPIDLRDTRILIEECVFKNFLNFKGHFHLKSLRLVDSKFHGKVKFHGTLRHSKTGLTSDVFIIEGSNFKDKLELFSLLDYDFVVLKDSDFSDDVLFNTLFDIERFKIINCTFLDTFKLLETINVVSLLIKESRFKDDLKFYNVNMNRLLVEDSLFKNDLILGKSKKILDDHKGDDEDQKINKVSIRGTRISKYCDIKKCNSLEILNFSQINNIHIQCKPRDFVQSDKKDPFIPNHKVRIDEYCVFANKAEIFLNRNCDLQINHSRFKDLEIEADGSIVHISNVTAENLIFFERPEISCNDYQETIHLEESLINNNLKLKKLSTLQLFKAVKVKAENFIIYNLEKNGQDKNHEGEADIASYNIDKSHFFKISLHSFKHYKGIKNFNVSCSIMDVDKEFSEVEFLKYFRKADPFFIPSGLLESFYKYFLDESEEDIADEILYQLKYKRSEAPKTILGKAREVLVRDFFGYGLKINRLFSTYLYFLVFFSIGLTYLGGILKGYQFISILGRDYPAGDIIGSILGGIWLGLGMFSDLFFAEITPFWTFVYLALNVCQLLLIAILGASLLRKLIRL